MVTLLSGVSAVPVKFITHEEQQAAPKPPARLKAAQREAQRRRLSGTQFSFCNYPFILNAYSKSVVIQPFQIGKLWSKMGPER